MARTFSRQCLQCSQIVKWPEMQTYPFCSERCRLIDLGVWARGDYRIPTEETAEDEAWSEFSNGDDEDEGFYNE